MIRFRPHPRPIPLRVTFPFLPLSHPLHDTILRLDYAICIARVNYLCGLTVASAIIALAVSGLAGTSLENNEFVLKMYDADDYGMIDLMILYALCLMRHY